jgi:hypothetical protein
MHATIRSSAGWHTSFGEGGRESPSEELPEDAGFFSRASPFGTPSLFLAFVSAGSAETNGTSPEALAA